MGCITGWRKSAIVNIGLMFACLMILIGVLAAAISATGNVSQSYKFYTASCVSATTTNTILHLAINILSTIILASSNFFMQVLNAPTGREVDIFTPKELISTSESHHGEMLFVSRG
ncbi:hypothetical protein CGCF415_v010561 [Colletotrichum fructicola]|uniref:DUF6536 domain-containing protein n=1 Tax=Colletotrichum fructicola (strain Nara gc5) TaxID=1213859 RepID=L2FGW0_COLFN|nr:uncharacterized protein CGMCC3_g10869 [Colletotrichum fructicola]KAF4475158.1 hypothetical protein CGGC5_v016172 [Colletotrichum fructicola Nara gc5]KAE9573126.1 hypothetical protein CGMCC3_g10869 [Colletotrichum fructicola]KAF4420991.1 hypothetical protein CFRS1_v005284 [Colletotrichum fructicola]KAF4882535.1 hypothetical protein CGCFRS4_v014475 [Colletotrichum fructicola]KAF4899268.1 hypothetical protein CGCF415_v010561 [Colletotrichum fructicola]